MEWLVWIRDMSSPWRTPEALVGKLNPKLLEVHLTIVGNPMRIAPTERHPGEWCLRLRDSQDEGTASVNRRVVLVCRREKFQLILDAQPAPRPVPRSSWKP
jgi:hypothetical protein